MTLRNPTSAKGEPIRPEYHTLGAPSENAYQERANGIALRLRLVEQLEEMRCERDALRLCVLVLENERDEARALGRIA